MIIETQEELNNFLEEALGVSTISEAMADKVVTMRNFIDKGAKIVTDKKEDGNYKIDILV